jgi:hypothetical protein
MVFLWKVRRNYCHGCPRSFLSNTNAGIDVDRIQTLDSGNYSVELFVRTASGNVETLWRSVYVHVTGNGVTKHRLYLYC